MALLERGLKQRIVGALVLIALAVIFLPMLFTREDESRQVVVEAPPRPQSPAMPSVEVQPTEVPELQPGEEGIAPEIVEEVSPAAAGQPSQPIGGLPATPPATQPPAQAQAQAPAASLPPSQPQPPAAPPSPPPAEKRLDANNLPQSWSVQLASLSNRARAEELQKTLRSQGYNAYIRSFDGMNRVFVGPVIQRAEADRLRDQLSKQQKLNGFVVRFQPERG
ncbi:SPOR domain-containing protein [Pseudomonas aeruginosa]|uniref:SPOR domain-containing protein n=6 Tax=Pseudomonas aeruginosa TaxID=287 RepID=UPI000FC42397|nr:SPOR domain-containing protein [Pseudomonas aeruginosa]HCL2714995.1 SPOR domain-containing protein [Pseudomonas aeruginosa EF8E]RUA73782.1 SPOR domain-containing protein [Pseudomonas aeruginosa]HBP6648578.1 SPOR domain-containing protein [Pseudomonas aeruginosa]HCL2721213.1 SPOR domain-containing protein [Pseudomonas aeruginosa EF8E]HCL2727429.1 SPOR domain-containing protein [Pseudomonas aeruginosa EF8E]